MAAIEVEAGVDIDPAELATFLAAQPDLGTKWAPRFVRLVNAIPLTATGKMDRQPLRAEGWDTTDPIWWRPSPPSAYEVFTPHHRARLRRAFIDAGRGGLLTPPE